MLLLPGHPPAALPSAGTRGRTNPTHTHGSHVVLVGFPHFLHDLLLGFAAVLNGALHCDGPLGVVQSQVLQADEKATISAETRQSHQGVLSSAALEGWGWDAEGT